MSNAALSRLTLGVAATASTAATASGAIVVFDINPDFVQNGFVAQFSGVGIDSVNLTNGTFVQGSSTQPQLFSLGVYYGGIRFLRGSSYQVATVISGGYLAELSLGSEIGASTPFQVLDRSTDYNTSLGSGVSFIGLRYNNGSGNLYGWAEVLFTAEDQFGFRDYTFTRFAFNDVVGESILAGQTSAVPEASTLGLVGGLFGLVAAAHVRRRKAKLAAASDKFLALAAGEKLN
jgi:hypothetical protein